MRLRPPSTLGGRVVAVLALVLTIGFAAAALTTVLVVRHVLISRLDAQLRAAGNRFAVGLEHNDHDADNGGSPYGSVQGQLAGTLGARMAGGRVTDAAVVGENDTTGTVPADAKARLATLRVDTTPTSISLPGLGTYRIIVTAGRDNDLQVTGLPAGPVEETIDHLVLIEVLVFAATLVAVALASTGLVRLMLRPLSRMAATAAEVSALPLKSGGVAVPHRVPETSSGSEVDVLSRTFNVMLAEVEGALVSRDEGEDRLRRFIADASHELRTPVAVVRSHAELAQRAALAETVPEEIMQSLGRIAAQAGRMGHLVEDLLLLARLDSGRPLAHDEVDLSRCVYDAVEDARATAPAHRWRLHLPGDPIVVADGDAHALGQVVVNLLANASTHTPPGTQVAVGLTVESHSVVLTVADDGPGMGPELAAHAFDRFVRGERARGGDRPAGTGQGSSGLGLPIVAAIVAAHGGTVELDSGPDGTTVRVVLRGGHPVDAGDPAKETDEALL